MVDLRAARIRLADLQRLRDHLRTSRNAKILAELDIVIDEAQAEVDALLEQVRQAGDIGLTGES